MTDGSTELGTIRRVDGMFEARLERQLEHHPAEVWAMLTDPAKLVQWLAPGEIGLHPGGRAKLDFADSGTVIDSTVRAVDPPYLLEYSWSGPGEPERPVRWDLRPSGSGTQLMLTLRIPQNENAARAAAGWEAHLEMLHAALEGAPIKFPFERFKSSRATYEAMLSNL
jgi:uncharacterized protein YndB with AHSA1/START domain